MTSLAMSHTAVGVGANFRGKPWTSHWPFAGLLPRHPNQELHSPCQASPSTPVRLAARPSWRQLWALTLAGPLIPTAGRMRGRCVAGTYKSQSPWPKVYWPAPRSLFPVPCGKRPARARRAPCFHALVDSSSLGCSALETRKAHFT